MKLNYYNYTSSKEVNKMNQKYKIYLAGFGKSIIYGLSFIFIKIIMEKMSMVSLLGIRFILAILIMIIMYLFKIIDINYKGMERQPFFRQILSEQRFTL